MIKKIIHTADWHIKTYKNHEEDKEVFINFINQTKELVKDFKREEIRIVIAGDLVHNKTVISNEQLIFCVWLLKELEQIAPLIIIAGNHDLNLNNKNRMDSITPIVSFLPDCDIKYFKETDCVLDDNVVWCVYSVFDDNITPDIEGAKVKFGYDKKYLGLFHEPVLNAKTDIGYVIDHGADLDKFNDLHACLMGDIHKYQVFIDKQTKTINKNELEYYKKIGWITDGSNTKIKKEMKAIFPSSLIHQNFGESVKNHGFVSWDVSDMSHEFYEVENKYKYYNFKISSIDDIENDKEMLSNL